MIDYTQKNYLNIESQHYVFAFSSSNLSLFMNFITILYFIFFSRINIQKGKPFPIMSEVNVNPRLCTVNTDYFESHNF